MRILLGVGLLTALAFTAGAAPRKKPHTADQGYVGTEACMACHEDLGKAFLKTRHGSLEREQGRGWKGQSCESCHGPGQQHGEAAEAKFILNHDKVSPREADASCLTCHKNQSTHAGRIGGSHAKAEVSCVGCHSVHHADPNPALPLFRAPSVEPGVPASLARLAVPRTRSARVNQQCSNCHGDVWAQFQRPHAHQLSQGAMSCIDCHNPHGTNRRAGTQSTARTNNNEPGCLRCHADKRGPFAFEHAPVRLEGCTACHENHGSTNPRMLIRPQITELCLECHANLPAPSNTTGTLGTVPTGSHDIRLPVFRNCTTCHTRIHGSHVSRDLLR